MDVGASATARESCVDATRHETSHLRPGVSGAKATN
jgi:hypothetical protein